MSAEGSSLAGGTGRPSITKSVPGPPVIGNAVTRPAERTPCMLRTLARICCRSTALFTSRSGYSVGERKRPRDKTPFCWKPGFTPNNRTKLLPSRPAPTSRTIASANCGTTSAWLEPCRVPPVDAAAPSLTEMFKSVCVPAHAGAIPKSSPVNSEISSVNPSTLQSMLISPNLGISCELRDAMNCRLHAAMPRPSPAPRIATTRLSVTNCRARRVRPAPIARRIANSF